MEGTGGAGSRLEMKEGWGLGGGGGGGGGGGLGGGVVLLVTLCRGQGASQAGHTHVKTAGSLCWATAKFALIQEKTLV